MRAPLWETNSIGTTLPNRVMPSPNTTSHHPRARPRAYIDLTSPNGRGFMAFSSAMAENERLRIIKRTHEGRAFRVAYVPTMRSHDPIRSL